MANLKHAVRRALEEVKATCDIAKTTSWGEAINTFKAKTDIQKVVRNVAEETPEVKERLAKKHETMLRYFEAKFHSFMEDYKAPAPGFGKLTNGGGV